MSLPGSVAVDRVGPSSWVVELRGEHDLSTVEGLRTELDAIFAQGTTVVIDLSDATFVDSAVLNELVSAQRRVDADPNERLAVVAPGDGFPARVLNLVNLDRLLSIFETRAEALRTLETS
jgi:anti-anti-sigma factor